MIVDIEQHVVVTRISLHGFRAALSVHQADRYIAFRHQVGQFRIKQEGRYVIDNTGTRVQRRLGHAGLARVYRNRRGDAGGAEGFDDRHSTADFFVDPDFGPVLANYGVDELRFLQPVNFGDSLRVRLVCKQKTLRGDSGYGEVRWDARVTNQDDEVVALYDVLTMVATDEHWASVA